MTKRLAILSHLIWRTKDRTLQRYLIYIYGLCLDKEGKLFSRGDINGFL